MKNVIVLLILSASYFSCTNKENKQTIPTVHQQEDVEIESTLSNLFYNLKEDTLILFYRKSECGEWGGSNYIIGFYKEEHHVKCYYKYYKANCEILEQQQDGQLPLTQKATILLTKEIDTLTISFIKELLDNQFHESSGFHAENLFAAKMGEQIDLFSNGGTARLHDLAQKIIDELKINE